jgi:hypothetical protein
VRWLATFPRQELVSHVHGNDDSTSPDKPPQIQLFQLLGVGRAEAFISGPAGSWKACSRRFFSPQHDDAVDAGRDAKISGPRRDSTG